LLPVAAVHAKAAKIKTRAVRVGTADIGSASVEQSTVTATAKATGLQGKGQRIRPRPPQPAGPGCSLAGNGAVIQRRDGYINDVQRFGRVIRILEM